jgi:hypothetical protein
MLPAMRRIFVASIICSIVPSCWTYVAPFGVRTNPTNPSSFVPRRHHQHFQQASPFLVAAAKKNKEEEDAWEPDETDLLSVEEEIDIPEDESDESVEPTTENQDTTVVAKGTEDDDDDDVDEDELDEGLDIWEDDEEDEDDGIVEEGEDEDEGASSSYSMPEEGDADDDEDWEEDEGNADIAVQDDPNDPNYQAQKKLLEETVARRDQLAADKSFDEVDFIMNYMTPEQGQLFDTMDIQKQVEAMSDDLIVIDEDDVKDMDPLKAMAKVTDIMDDPYENEGEENIMGTGISDDILQKYDETLKEVRENIAQEPWDKVNLKAQTVDWATLPNNTIVEMDACLDEIGGSAYNVTNWLLYDLDFNVSNLILAAVKHNRAAPVLFQHWYPQLLTYDRYEHARDRNFDFNWQDVANADMEELERYYMGFGYTEIPNKAPGETGMISFEELDEEELKMAAFENWMTEVYNPEWDKKDFDDDAFQDEDNVFSKFYAGRQHPDQPTYEDAEEDLRDWEAEMDDDEDATEEYANMMGHDIKYQQVDDPEFEKEFRGHLVVACTPNDADLEIAETLTKRMDKEFGKQIYVETRVIAHAREEDMVFEVWLESFDIDILHSKKRAMSNVGGWDGPEECDAKQIDYLVGEIRFLISDDARYGYRFDNEFAV